MNTDEYQVTITRDEKSMVRLIDALELAALNAAGRHRAELETLRTELATVTGLVR